MLMDQCIEANGSGINMPGKEFISLQMELCMKANGRII